MLKGSISGQSDLVVRLLDANEAVQTFFLKSSYMQK